MVWVFVSLSQSNTIALGGEIGWLNLITQLGSFGLLVYFAVFLAPKIVNRFAIVLEADATSRGIVEREHAVEISRLVQAFREETKYEREQCQHHFEVVVSQMVQVQMTCLAAIKSVETTVQTHHHFSVHAVDKLSQVLSPQTNKGET